MSIIQRLKNLWFLSHMKIDVVCPNGRNCESCKRYFSGTGILHNAIPFGEEGSVIKLKSELEEVLESQEV